MTDKQSKGERFTDGAVSSDPECASLSGKRIVVPSTGVEPDVLGAQLRALGADVLDLPTIRIEPPTDLRAFAELVQDAHAYDWIVFTSPDGVTMFFDLFYKLYDDAREIGAARIAAVGPSTAQRIKEFRLHVDLQSAEFDGDAIVREFRKDGSVENLRILLVRAEKARELLAKEITALGAIVDEGFAYRTVPETRDDSGARRQFFEEGADLITFTSLATVENFLALGLPWPAGMQIASIGPATSKAARDRGLEVAVEARRHDISGLVDAVGKFFSRKLSNERG
jgi:uroporphyrinogen III methyltransferase / synthase